MQVGALICGAGFAPVPKTSWRRRQWSWLHVGHHPWRQAHGVSLQKNISPPNCNSGFTPALDSSGSNADAGGVIGAPYHRGARCQPLHPMQRNTS